MEEIPAEIEDNFFEFTKALLASFADDVGVDVKSEVNKFGLCFELIKDSEKEALIDFSRHVLVFAVVRNFEAGENVFHVQVVLSIELRGGREVHVS